MIKFSVGHLLSTNKLLTLRLVRTLIGLSLAPFGALIALSNIISCCHTRFAGNLCEEDIRCQIILMETDEKNEAMIEAMIDCGQVA